MFQNFAMHQWKEIRATKKTGEQREPSLPLGRHNCSNVLIKPDAYSNPREHLSIQVRQVSWLVTFLPTFSFSLWKTMVRKGKNFAVTYSCGTARDLHTIPY